MPRTLTDEAIVLRTYNVGEADRFCLLLTKSHGRIAARACGARRMMSRRCGSLLPFQIVSVECREHHDRYDISSCSPVSAVDVSSNLRSFVAAQQAAELILRCTGEGEALTGVYTLFADFLDCCCSGANDGLVPAFSIKLLSLLGLLPSLSHSCVSGHALSSDISVLFSPERGGFCLESDAVAGRTLSVSAFSWLQRSVHLPLREMHPLTRSLEADVTQCVQSLIGSQLGASLVTAPLAVRIASGSTPSSNVSDLVS